jgi:hypothetical protein
MTNHEKIGGETINISQQVSFLSKKLIVFEKILTGGSIDSEYIMISKESCR